MSFQLWSQVRSAALGMDTALTVVTPPVRSAASTAKGTVGNVSGDYSTPPRLLILLHGLTGNHLQYVPHINLSALAERHNLVIALPDGNRSFWIDQAYGLRWGQWVGEELPQLLRSTLRLGTQPQDLLIGGLSMGGYGAVRAVFDYPETFGGAFSLSGTLDVAEPAFSERHPDLYQTGFGCTDPAASHPGTQNDLLRRLESSAHTLPPMFICCGTEDRLLAQNERFVAAAQRAEISPQWHRGPGDHTFKYWRQMLPIALDYFYPQEELA